MTAALNVHDAKAVQRFIEANTKQLAPPLVPEITLHLAEESLAIWRQTEEDLGAINVPPPYWAFAWAGGQALARCLLDTPALATGRTVLDLGCGSGLQAIAAMKAGATRCVAADIDLIALQATMLNAAHAGVTLSITTDNLLAAPPDPAFSLILVGDLFYERQLAADVLTFIERATDKGAVALIGDPRRNYFPRNRFDEVARYQVPVTRDLEDALIKDTAVWRLG
jgi:predicted nicotinamide N-methyase